MANFGNESIEASTGQLSNSMLGLVSSATATGKIESITAYLAPTGTRLVKYALYEASDDSLLGITAEISVSSTGWHKADFSTSVDVNSASSYYIMAISDGSFAITIARASSATAGRYKAQAYGDGFPDPSATSNNNFVYSIYATYEESAPDTNQWASYVSAWIYPGVPACNADEEYSDGRYNNTLKPEYYRVIADGSLEQITEGDDGCNGYTSANAADVKANSTNQLVTISCGDPAYMDALCSSSGNRATAISDLTTFLGTVGFTGVELNWEGFGSWTSTHYTNFKTFVDELGTSLHGNGYTLAITFPAIWDATSQSWFEFIYEDFNSLPVDWYVVMAYDYMYDYSAGQAVAPNTWVESICDWAIDKMTDKNKIVMGIPSYGYHETTEGYSITIDTKAQSSALTGYSGATRDAASEEMNWENEGVSYFYQDTTGMNAKREIIEAKGITNVSVWHLGGNDWFTGIELEPTPSNCREELTQQRVAISQPRVAITQARTTATGRTAIVC